MPLLWIHYHKNRRLEQILKPVTVETEYNARFYRIDHLYWAVRHQMVVMQRAGSKLFINKYNISKIRCKNKSNTFLLKCAILLNVNLLINKYKDTFEFMNDSRETDTLM